MAGRVRVKTGQAIQLSIFYSVTTPVPVAVWSKVRACGISLAGIAGSNPAGVIDVCILLVLCAVRQRSLRRANHSSRRVLQTAVCMYLYDREASKMRRPWPTRGCCTMKKM
jgi:hypothetical protein